MADNINYNESRGTYSFYSLKERPWHNLGAVVDQAQTPQEILITANLDYEVKLAPLFASFVPSGTTQIHMLKSEGEIIGYDCVVDNEIVRIAKKGTQIFTNYATYRADTLDVFGVVGSRYEPVQNDVAIDFIYGVLYNQNILSKSDIIIETAGVLGAGEKIFVTAKLPTYSIANDEVDRYILFTTTHDGSGSITACFTNIRVVCNNTLNAALQTCTNKMLFKHTKNVKNRLTEGAKLMANTLLYSQMIKEGLTHASTIDVTEREAIQYVEDLFLTEEQIEYAESKGGFLNLSNGDEMISTKTLNKMIEVINYIEKGVGQDSNYGTALWLYNGVTSYINNGIIYKSNEDKFQAITDGVGFKLQQKAFNVLNNYV